MANPRVDDLRKRLEKEPGSRLFAQLAEELRKDGDLEEAIRVAREGLQKHPAYPSARMTLGRALLDKGELGACRTEFESVLKGAPDNILASRFLAECLEGLGDLAGAVVRYKATLILSPGDRQVQSRLEAVEDKLRRRATGSTAPMGAALAGGAASGPEEPRPIPVAQVDEPMILESAHEGRAVRTGEPPVRERSPDEPPPIPLARVEESFELERPYEPVQPTPWKAEPYTPSGEVVFEEADVTMPPSPPVTRFHDATSPPFAAVDAEPVVEAEILVEPAEIVEPPPIERENLVGSAAPVETAAFTPTLAAPQAEAVAPPLTSSTLAELYFNQGFTDKAIEVYRQLLAREPENERGRARLREIEALDRHLRAEEHRGAPAPPGPVAVPASAPETDPRTRRREAIERTIARLEGFLVAVRRG